MKINEIPGHFVQVDATTWSDVGSRMRYMVDPSNPDLLVWRPWSEKEVAEFLSKQNIQGQNIQELELTQVLAIEKLINDIGPVRTLKDGSPNPELIPGPTSFNAILDDTKANINANPTPYIKFLTRALKTTDKTLLAVIKRLNGLVDDANLGAE